MGAYIRKDIKQQKEKLLCSGGLDSSSLLNLQDVRAVFTYNKKKIDLDRQGSQPDFKKINEMYQKTVVLLEKKISQHTTSL